jgi:putative IMPACT (imprinted ancient) family translation regulator
MFDKIKFELHPKARHWCYAYIGGNDEERSSDDGEPAGTGGQPILSAIKTSNLVDTMCIVVRYYGGIQLGTGGLIRAYGLAAREVLKIVPTQIQIPTASVRVTVEPLWIGTLYDTIQKTSCWIDDTEPTLYDDDGSVSVTVKCNIDDIDQFKNTLYNLTKGSAKF